MSNITSKIDPVYGKIIINGLFDQPLELRFCEANVLKRRLSHNSKFPFEKLKFYQTDFEKFTLDQKQKNNILVILKKIPQVV